MELAFFSFVTLQDATAADHRAYNEWHQLDHRPENLALPGVAWGDRWARPEDHRAGAAAPEHADTDYVAMYWFRSPVEESVRAWDRLGEDSFQWGRGPLIPGVRRTLLAFFHPVQGYAARSALVSPQVLPYRPNRGVHVTLTRHPEPHSLATHEHHRFEDRTLMPALCELDGVAGGWTFSLSHHQRHSTLSFGDAPEDRPGSLRLRLLYLDGDTLETTRLVNQADAALREAAGLDPDAAQVLFDSPLRTIVPWQDW